MPSTLIEDFPKIGVVTLDDVIIIEQTEGATSITYQGTVRQLVGSFSPVPKITNLTWDGGSEQLTIEGENLQPTTLVEVDGVLYPLDSFVYGALPNSTKSASLFLEIPSTLEVGNHVVKVKNLIHEATDSFTI